MNDFELRTNAAFQSFNRALPDLIAWDTETTGLQFDAVPFCMTVAWRNKQGELESHYIELDETGREVAQLILWNTKTWVLHNAKFDVQKMLQAGILDRTDLDGVTIHDTEALAHLDDEHRRKGLKYLAHLLLGEDTNEEQVLKAEMRKRKLKKSEGYDKLPHDLLVPYALKDAEFTYRLYELLRPRVERYTDLWDLYTLEQGLMLVLLDMECAGMAVDMGYARSTAKDYASEILRSGLEIRRIVGRDDFNPNSPKQILEAFEKLGIEAEATDKHTLSGIDHPLAQELLNLRKATKMHGTYLVPLTQEPMMENGHWILHPNFRQHGTRTGRMSSGGAEA